jgi:hypothetical protein
MDVMNGLVGQPATHTPVSPQLGVQMLDPPPGQCLEPHLADRRDDVGVDVERAGVVRAGPQPRAGQLQPLCEDSPTVTFDASM